MPLSKSRVQHFFFILETKTITREITSYFEKLHIPKVDYIPIFIIKITSSYTGTCSNQNKSKKVDEYNIGKRVGTKRFNPTL